MFEFVRALSDAAPGDPAPGLGTLMLYAAAAIAAMQVLVWIGSVIRTDASLVDRFWGPGFTLAGTVVLLYGGGDDARRVLLFVMSLWGLRLGFHLTRRNWGDGEDKRYQKMRKYWGEDRFWWISFFTVYVLQGVLMWLVALPLVIGGQSTTPVGLTWLDFLGLTVWISGLVIEAVADAQLRRFVGDPSNRGQVMDRGLWSWSRHPNYFGNAVLWWGIGLVAVQTQFGWAALIGPLVMNWLLRYFSGVPILERHMARTKDGWEEYCRRTNIFVPLPPKD